MLVICGEYLLSQFPPSVIILPITWPQQLSVYLVYLMMFIFLVRTAIVLPPPHIPPPPQLLPVNLFIQGTAPLFTI